MRNSADICHISLGTVQQQAIVIKISFSNILHCKCYSQITFRKLFTIIIYIYSKDTVKFSLIIAVYIKLS